MSVSSLCSQIFHSYAYRLTGAKDSVTLNDIQMNEVANPPIYVVVVQRIVLSLFLRESAEYCRVLPRCKAFICVSGVDQWCLYNFDRNDEAPLT